MSPWVDFVVEEDWPAQLRIFQVSFQTVSIKVHNWWPYWARLAELENGNGTVKILLQIFLKILRGWKSSNNIHKILVVRLQVYCQILWGPEGWPRDIWCYSGMWWTAVWNWLNKRDKVLWSFPKIPQKPSKAPFSSYDVFIFHCPQLGISVLV